jgi:ABC-type transport system substrate-binding protein
VPTETTIQMVQNGTVRVYPDLETVPGAGSSLMFENLLFNVSPPDVSLPSYFSTLNVRQAVDLCLDRRALTDAIYGGLVAPLEFAIPSDHPLLEGSSLQTPQFNIQMAGSLLDASGWRDEDGDGVREPLNLQFVSPDDNFTMILSELITSQLLACGMSVTTQLAPSRDLLAQNADALLSGRHFDLALLSSPMGVESLCELAGTKQISSEANGWSGSNLSGYSNVLFDAACVQVNSSLPGTPEYTTSRQTALLLFSQAELLVPLFQHTRFTLADPALTGLEGGWQAIESFRMTP